MEATVLATLQQRKSSMAKKPTTKQARKKTKPIKVRYISNPMKVETCASKFRELVQELTGRDASDLPPDPPVFPAEYSSPVDRSVAAEIPVLEAHEDPYDVADRVPDYYEPLDGDAFASHLSDGFSECFTNGFYNVNALGSIDSV